MSISRIVSNKNGDFSRKSHFLPPRVSNAPIKGSSLRIGFRRSESKKNSNDGAAGPRKMFDDIFNHLDTIHERDGQARRGRYGVIWR